MRSPTALVMDAQLLRDYSHQANMYRFHGIIALLLALNSLVQAQPATKPVFPTCDSALNKQQCTDRRLLDFMHGNLKWPTSLDDVCFAGKVVVQFAVNAEGMVVDPKIVRGIHPTMDEEVLRVVNLMVDRRFNWIPGKDNKGQSMAVWFYLPINVTLE